MLLVFGPLEREAEQQFQAGGAGRGFAERQQLLVVVDRGVIGADRVHGAVQHGRTDRVAVALRAQRRGQARVGIEEADVGVGHVQVVHADVDAEVQAFLLGGADQVQAGGGRDAAQVHARAGGAHQFEDRVQRDGLGHHRHARQAQARRQRAAVGHAAAADVGVLRTQPHGVAEGLGVLHGAQQHGGVEDRFLGLGEADAAGFGQFGHLGQRLALQAHGQRAQRVHIGLVEHARAVLEHFDQAGFVEHRIGVGRAHQRGHAALHRCLQLGLQGGLVFVARLAQARRQVDQAGSDHQAGRVDGLVGVEARRGGAERRDPAVGDEQVLRCVDAVRRVDHSPVLDMKFHAWVPAKMLITAIRTAIPKVTCGRITAWAPSATAESISTPRFIGPGCITIASGFASARRSGVRP